jgi:hypothetical protein
MRTTITVATLMTAKQPATYAPQQSQLLANGSSVFKQHWGEHEKIYKLHLAVLTSILAMLAACSDPHNYPVTKLTEQQKKEIGVKLTADEGQKLTAWMFRQAVSKQDVSPETTVAQAIKQQDEWVAKTAVEEAKAAELKKRIEEERQAKQAEFAKIVTVAMISKKNVEQSYGRKFIALDVAFENRSQKDIRGILGTLVITDIFDQKIKAIGWVFDSGVPANGRYVETGSGIDVNQFIDSDMKLWNTDEDKLKTHFDVKKILFKDGTSEDAPV